MGKVLNRIRLTNTVDRGRSLLGELAESAIRSESLDALVDTGATTLAIPKDLAERLGCRVTGTRQAKMADGRLHPVEIVTDLTIEILGREMACDAFVLPVGAPVLIGQIPLEGLDLVVDPRNREVRVNPEHPDAPVYELYTAG